MDYELEEEEEEEGVFPPAHGNEGEEEDRLDLASSQDVLFFHTCVRAHDLVDARKFPPDIKVQYTVTGALKHIRTPRTNPIGRIVAVNGHELALFRFGRRIFCSQARCPHMGGDLCFGDVGDIEDLMARRPPVDPNVDNDDDYEDEENDYYYEGGEKNAVIEARTEEEEEDDEARLLRLAVNCPVHQWKFSLNGEGVGRCHTNTSYGLNLYPVRVVPETGEIQIGFTQFDSSLFTSAPDF